MAMSDPAPPAAPPLPPRPSPALAPALQPYFTETIVDSHAAVPPPLPPRSSSKAPPPPLDIRPSEDTETSSVTVAITPATPPQSNTPVEARLPSLGSRANDLTQGSRDDPKDGPSSNHLPAPTPPPRLPRSPSSDSRSDQPQHRWTPSRPALPPRPTTSMISVVQPKDWLQWLILAALALNFLYVRLSPFWLLVLGAGYLMSNRLDVIAPAGGLNESASSNPGDGRLSVGWVNHALYALFPLISTEVLTPFMDLLEDALIEQVPPIVTSVRLTSAALGDQPVVLTSLRPLSDQEWFAAISTGDHKSSASRKGEIRAGHRKKLPSMSKMMSPIKRRKSASRVSRSASRSSGSAMDSDDVLRESQTRQRRDDVVHSISHRRAREAANPHDDGGVVDEDAPITPATKGEDGDRIIGGTGDTVEEDDPNSGQYVNYQVGFEYHRQEKTTRKGWGLHVLAYFGVGIKGIGKAEVPVYIDLLSLKGTVNIRILLSATPPFVRTATISLPSIPEWDISAHPLKIGTFNATQLPGMKTYLQASILEVAEEFLRPKSYTMDVDRLLLGRDAALRTQTVGVLHMIIHSAENLPKTDAMGSTDAYVSVSFSKYNKPLYSTRTIIDTLNPSWEEPAFILVTADAIESGERLRLRLVDSDRLSADDDIGVVEVDLTELVDESNSADGSYHRRHDHLKADRPGMKTSGRLEWSVRFCPLWQMPLEEMSRRMQDKGMEKYEPQSVSQPWWIEFLAKFAEDKPGWETARAERRKETLAWFTGEKERDEMEATARPSNDLRSGILQFHIHQCTDLELESLGGTFSSDLNHRKSSASGKPALADVIDRTPAENPDPPSAYCEVHLNDRYIYRTRTKQVTPLPYFNAVSERFIRDWRMAKIVFVVRDDRDREHDPILGLVSVHLRDALADRSQFTRWFPLVGGIGWGRIRISLLWKSVDMRLPPRVSGYEIATLEFRALSATDVAKHADRNMLITLETETDSFTLASLGADLDGSSLSLVRSPSSHRLDSPGTPRSNYRLDLPGTPGSFTTKDQTELEWNITKPIRLAVEYRQSCSVLVSFVTRSSVLKKKRIIGLATFRLDDCPDGEESQRTLPIFATSEVKDAIHAGASYWALQNGKEPPRRQADQAKLIGFVSLSFVLHPGVSRAHRKICKRDLRLRHVYEAWEVAKEMNKGQDKSSVGDTLRSTKLKVMDDSSEESSSEYEPEGERDEVEGTRQRTAGPLPGQAMLDDQDSEDEKGFMEERRSHSHALHKRNKGIFQLKIARTGKFVKDKIEAKLLTSTKQRRQRGTDLDVELEGQSAL